MSERRITEQTGGKLRRLPIATVILASGVALGSWQSSNEIVRSVTEVLPSSPWETWLTRWPGSFFVASPLVGEPTDGVLAVTQTAIALGINERRTNWRRMLVEAAVFQAVGCMATRLYEVSGLLPQAKMHEPDVGPSAVTVAFGTKYLIQRARESAGKARVAWYIGASALGVAAIGGAWAAGDTTSAVGHAAGFMSGLIVGRMYQPELSENVEASEADTPIVLLEDAPPEES